MKENEYKFDVVIIGSGMGGLACANILSRKGYKVVVLEKNHQIGGNLQVFSRDKTIFDTGVHYIGGLDEGQNLHTLFKYFGILDHLKLLRMDEKGFDKIHFYNEDTYYSYGMGYDQFRENLIRDFPDEVEAIDEYIRQIKWYCSKFPLYSLSNEEGGYNVEEVVSANAKELIESLTENKRLQDIFSATSALYAGSDITPFYVHALVVNSYIESAWKCIDGGSQIAIQMQKQIRKYGGEVWRRAKVVQSEVDENRKIKYVTLSDGRKVYGDYFISNVHPKQTIEIVGEEPFRPAYVNRIRSLKNTVSSFTLHLVFKENCFEYMNYNLYQMYGDDIWNAFDYDKETWPDRYMLSTPASSKNQKYAEGASIMCYMNYEDVEQWADSFNTVAEKGDRPSEYEKFKIDRAEKILDVVEREYPTIRSCIKSYYCSTPLTFRDYIGNDDGNLYGIEKDSNDGLKTFINPKTRVKNLFLTGSNLNLHGILGVSISALVTCFELIDKKELLEDINSCR